MSIHFWYGTEAVGDIVQKHEALINLRQEEQILNSTDRIKN